MKTLIDVFGMVLGLSLYAVIFGVPIAIVVTLLQ